MVTKIVNNDMSEAKASKLALVDFSATWCGPCQMLAPVLEELAEEMKGQADFYNVDVDENGQLAMEFGIMNIPALVVLKDGEKVGMSVGFQPKESLRELLEKNR